MHTLNYIFTVYYGKGIIEHSLNIYTEHSEVRKIGSKIKLRYS